MTLPTAGECANARTAVLGMIDPISPTGTAFRYHKQGRQGPDQCQGRPSRTVTFALSILQREEGPDVTRPARIAVLTNARGDLITCLVDGHNTSAETA